MTQSPRRGYKLGTAARRGSTDYIRGRARFRKLLLVNKGRVSPLCTATFSLASKKEFELCPMPVTCDNFFTYRKRSNILFSMIDIGLRSVFYLTSGLFFFSYIQKKKRKKNHNIIEKRIDLHIFE